LISIAHIFLLFTAENDLAGTIPHEIRALGALRVFSVFANSLTGTIPDVLSEMPSLQVFDVEINRLIGKAFVNLSGASSLEGYRVSVNSLTGTIPDLSQAGRLKEVWAARNSVEGTIPASVGALSNLGTFRRVFIMCIYAATSNSHSTHFYFYRITIPVRKLFERTIA
jgi:hypothetical protein